MFRKSFHIIITVQLLFCAAFEYCHGQDIHYSNNYENFFNLNPSAISKIKNTAFIANYRNQWPGSADFVNYSATILTTFKEYKSTTGIQILRDNQGQDIITNTDISVFYAYRTKFSTNLTFSAGLCGSYILYSLNSNNLVFENNQSPANPENQKKQYLDFMSGIEIDFYKKNTLGVSISHMSSPQINTETDITYKYILNYHGTYNLMNPYSFRKIYLEPVIISSFQSNASELFYGSKINIGVIQGGLFLRNDKNFRFDSFVILLGINFGNITVNYTYDINLSGSQSRFNKLASHEVTFFYNLEYNIGRNKKGAIKCPKI
jgi:type IX secretion system PorP/SprF family membrane protein